MKKLLNNLSKNNLIVDSFWALLGNVVFKGLSLLGGILVARLLGKNIFGEFSIIKTTFISIAFITTLGFGYTATKFVADYKKNHPEKLYAIFKFTQKTILILTSIASYLIKEDVTIPLTVNFCGFVIVLTGQLLNTKGYTSSAAFLLMIFSASHYLMISCYIAPGRFVEFFYLSIPSTTLMLFKPNSDLVV